MEKGGYGYKVGILLMIGSEFTLSMCKDSVEVTEGLILNPYALILVESSYESSETELFL